MDFAIARTVRARPAMTAALSAAAVLSALAMATPSILRSTALDIPSPAGQPVAADAAPARGAVRNRARCDTCGIVDAIRHVEASAGRAASWEFTVRMRDGSLRKSTAIAGANGASRWQAGDHIMLIGSAPAASLP